MSQYDTMPAGPEIDRLVAERVMGWEPRNEHNHRWWYGLGAEEGRHVAGEVDVWTGDHRLLSFKPSTNIAHAWEVVQKMSTHRNPDRPALWWNMVVSGFALVPGFDLSLSHIMHDRPSDMPLAICRAALKAVEKETPK